MTMWQRESDPLKPVDLTTVTNLADWIQEHDATMTISFHGDMGALWVVSVTSRGTGKVVAKSDPTMLGALLKAVAGI